VVKLFCLFVELVKPQLLNLKLQTFQTLYLLPTTHYPLSTTHYLTSCPITGRTLW